MIINPERETSGVDPVTAYRWYCAACDEVGIEFDSGDAEQSLYEHEDERHD